MHQSESLMLEAKPIQPKHPNLHCMVPLTTIGQGEVQGIYIYKALFPKTIP